MSTPFPSQWCRKLRWKSYAVDQESPQLMHQVMTASTCTFSCLDTQLPYGVDDQVTAPETCTQGRVCYEPHPHSRLPVV